MSHSKYLAIPAFAAVVVLAVGLSTQAASGAQPTVPTSHDGQRTQLPAPSPAPLPTPAPSPSPSPTPSPSPSPSPTYLPTPGPGLDGGR